LSRGWLALYFTLLLGRKKKYLWFRFPTDPIFFCRPYYFFNAIDRATLFSPGGCGLLIQRAKMASVVTLLALTLGRYCPESKAVVFFAYRFRLGYIVFGMDVASY
jgi:hypothetical protein